MKKDDEIYGSKLTRKDLDVLIPKNTPIPFVYVYACILELTCSQNELYDKLLLVKNKIPDCKNIVNNNTGTKFDSIIIEFTRKQWAIDFRFKENEIWVNLNFREKGQNWGSNYALWLLHQKWIIDTLGMNKLRDDMNHVNPVDIKLPK